MNYLQFRAGQLVGLGPEIPHDELHVEVVDVTQPRVVTVVSPDGMLPLAEAELRVAARTVTRVVPVVQPPLLLRRNAVAIAMCRQKTQSQDDGTLGETRDKFVARLTAVHILPRRDIARIRLAYLMAKHVHRAQKRKELGPDGEPLRYFEHVRRAALIAIDELGFADPLLIMGLLLHDSVEDRAEEMDWDMVEVIGGDQLVRLLKLLTKDGTDGYVERLTVYGDWRALFAKGCDRLDNLRSLSAFKLEKQIEQIRETRDKYLPLFARLIEIAPPEHRQKAVILEAAIRAIVEHYEQEFARSIEFIDGE